MRRFAATYGLEAGLVFVVVVWGFSPSVFKIALTELQPLAFIMLRFTMLSVIAVGVLLARARRNPTIRPFHFRRDDIGWLVISGLAGYGIYQVLYLEGLARTTPFASSLLLATVPLWSAVILALFRIERIGPLQWLGILMSLAGVSWFLLAGRSHISEFAADRALTLTDVIIGDALSLAAAGLFAVYGVVNKRLTMRYTPAELMCYTLLIGTVALTPLGAPALIHQDWTTVTWRTWVILPYSVVFPIYLTYSIWNWAIGARGVGYVTIFNYAVPIVTGLVAWGLFGEQLTPIQMVSAALTLSGMLLARWAIIWTARKESRAHQEALALTNGAPVAREGAD